MASRIGILQSWVDAVTMEEVLDKVVEYVENGHRPYSIFASNPAKTFYLTKDQFFHNVFREADLLIPDGIGLVLAAKILFGIEFGRIPGVELMQNICKLSAQKGYKIFIYGAKENVNKSAVEILKTRYPGIDIVGRANGYLGKDEMSGLVKKINSSAAQILFLALGSPKQEKWFGTYGDRLESVRICQGIGGTLDTVTGNLRRAPKILRKLGLEWLYRTLTDPRKLKRAQLNLLFGVMVILKKFRIL